MIDNLADKKLIVMISGTGNNLAAIIAAKLPVTLVISDQRGASGLAIARDQGIRCLVLEAGAFKTKAGWEAALYKLLGPVKFDLIVLAGFMKILSPELVKRLEEKIVNIHPSLLPVFPGLNTHTRAIKERAIKHGCSVHWVTKDVDAGPIIGQAGLTVNPQDTPEELSKRVKNLEQGLYPLLITGILAGKISYKC